jgi:hypothetical protein
MKLQSLIATALVITIGSAIFAQTPAAKTKPATSEKSTSPRLDRFGDPLPAGAIVFCHVGFFYALGPKPARFSPKGEKDHGYC